MKLRDLHSLKDEYGYVRPVWWWIPRVLKGELPLEEAPYSIQSVAKLYIYQGAEEVLTLPTHERRAALDKVPASLRGVMGEEVKRLWKARREGGSTTP